MECERGREIERGGKGEAERERKKRGGGEGEGGWMKRELPRTQDFTSSLRCVCVFPGRCESFSTVDSSLELRRSSDPEDNLSHSFSTPPSNFPLHGHVFRPPRSAPCSVTLDPCSLLPSSSSSSVLLKRDSSPSVFPFDGPFPLPSSSSSSSSLCTNQHSAPRLPPKPCHQSHASGPWPANELPLDHSRPIPRRISFSGTDHTSTGGPRCEGTFGAGLRWGSCPRPSAECSSLSSVAGHADSFTLGNKRLSLNLVRGGHLRMN